MKGTGEFEHAAGGFSEILGWDEDALNGQVARGQCVCAWRGRERSDVISLCGLGEMVTVERSTPLTHLLHASFTPLTRLLHASYTPLTRL
jgi:hypothetical protein